MATVADPEQIPMPSNWREVEDRLLHAEQVINDLPEGDRPRGMRSGHPEIIREVSTGDYATALSASVTHTAHDISQAFEAVQWPALLLDPPRHDNRQKAKLIRRVITFKVRWGTHVDWTDIKCGMRWFAARNGTVRMRYQRALKELAEKV